MVIDARVWFIASLYVLLFSAMSGSEMPQEASKATPTVEVVASDAAELSEEQLAHRAWEEAYGGMGEQELLKGVVHEPVE